MGAPLREVDIDVGDPDPPQRNVGGLTIPLQWASMLLLQTALAAVWLDHRFEELRAEIYHQQDATRDLALRDQRIDELTRRISILERYADRRGTR